MLPLHTFQTFSTSIKEASTVGEAAKTTAEVAAKTTAEVAKKSELLKGVRIRDGLAFGAGAGTLYGGNRLLKDVQTGEQVRKQQQQQGRY